MPAIAFATYPALPDLAVDEHPLLERLAELDIRGVPAVWDDPNVDWNQFDGVIIRSCWDYHLRVAEFFAWIERVERDGIPMWNAPATLRWNSRKTYLHDLTIGGVRTVPTLWLLADNARRATVTMESILDDTGWEHAVVKPVLSASAHNTWKVSRAEARANGGAQDERLRTLIARDGVMVQPFVPEIESDGEWSLQFFGGMFSHAVLKRAKPGDFRVQREFGGTHETVTPTPAVLRQAERALRSAPGESLYARVDGAVIDGELVVTELELLEPSLFLDADPEAPTRFAAAIAAICHSERSEESSGSR
jgi:glutathione synthase/RimK-type ligase-like ATP-grasp enzyme